MLDYDRIFIGGRWIAPATGKTIEVASPHDGAVAGRVPEATEADIDVAVAAARTAFDSGPWPRMSPAERAEVLRRFAVAHAARNDEFARLVTAENGSPLWYTQALHQYIAYQNDAYLIAGDRFSWEEERDALPQGRTLVRAAPVGVVAAIIPWNAPHQSALVKLFPALLAGCSVILKLAPETAIDGQVLGDMFNEAGLPQGVLSIVAAHREVSEYLVSHPGVDKIAFTGSSSAGRRIAAIAGADIKRVSLELGGKSACVVLDDADIDTVIPALRYASFMNTGQVCLNQTRLLVPDSLHDRFVDLLVGDVEGLKIGNPAEDDTFFGPLVAERQRVRVEDYISLGQSEGARLVTGGNGRPAGIEQGAYVRPTVFVDVDNRMRIAQEEIFGPVVAVIRYRSDEEAIAIANDTKYGLGGGVWSGDPERAKGVARRLRTGMIGINGGGPDFLAPAGGFKQSGLGREMGAAGIGCFVEMQSIGL